MKAGWRQLLSSLWRDERGQIFPWMIVLSGLITGVAGLTIDLGTAYVSYGQLKASTDAAALAGAYAMSQPGATTSSVTTAIGLYASAAGGANANQHIPNVTLATPIFKCITDSNMVAAPCGASGTGFNVVQVHQTAAVPTIFITMLQLFRIPAPSALTMSATSTATMASGANDQVNVAIVVDSTHSMGSQDTDVNCGNTRIYCALEGVRYMLSLLAPCTASTSNSSSTCTPYDRVSLFTFPNVQASAVSNDTSCTGTMPSSGIVPYSTPAKGATWSAPTGSSADYQITGYLSNWTSSNQVGGSLSSSSNLVEAVGGPSGSCSGGLQPIGGEGTYLAGAIYAAQSSLVAQSTAIPGSRNIMVILSDGDQNASSGHMVNGSGQNIGNNGNTYPSLQDQCHQGITAANYATASGTTVYTIAYGAPSSGCSTDTGGLAISPCSELQQMSTGYVSASNAPRFYSDATASANPGQCTSTSNPNLNLNGIFGAIAAQLTKARLLPNNIS